MEPDASRRPPPSISNPSPNHQAPETPETILARYGPSVYNIALYDPAPYEHEKYHAGIDHGVQMRDAQGVIRGSGQKVHVKGLNGVTVDLEIQTGRTYRRRSDHTDLERYITGPLIQYVTFQNLAFQNLTSTSPRLPFVPRLAYCNLRLHFLARARDKTTSRIFYAPQRPYEEVKTNFEKIREYWNTTPPCAELKSLLSTSIPHCNKIIAFGLGEVSRVRINAEECLTRHALEHLVLLTVRDALSQKNENQHKISCYAQDPAYTDVDKSLLAAYGVSVVDDPQGFLLADESSAIISCRAMVPVKSIICDLTRPALLIWDKFTEGDLDFEAANSDEPRVRMIIQNHYKRFKFPGDDEYSQTVAIYVRRPLSNSVW